MALPNIQLGVTITNICNLITLKPTRRKVKLFFIKD